MRFQYLLVPLCLVAACLVWYTPKQQCDRGWRGDSCSELSLEGFGLDVYPGNASLSTMHWEDRPYPWGGDCIVSPDDDLYHCYFAEYLNHCPMTYPTWYTSTHIRHAVASSPEGPYTARDVAVPKAAGNPVLLKQKTSDGYYVMYFTNQRFVKNVRDCMGRNTTAEQKEWHTEAVYNHGSPMGVNMAYSKSLNGPWELRYDLIGMHSTNPAAVLLPNGTVLLGYKIWFKAGNAIAVKSTGTGGWNSSYTHKPMGDRYVVESKDCEDPSMYRDPDSGIIHMVLHVLGAGSSAHSHDDGTSWRFNISRHSYEYEVNMTSDIRDGGPLHLKLTNREEPKFLLDKDGFPTHLINQAAVRSLVGYDIPPPPDSGYHGNQSTHLTFTLMQPLTGRLLRNLGFSYLENPFQTVLSFFGK